MRLDKFIGSTTDLSRKAIHACIKAGQVMLNGQRATSAAQSVTPEDRVQLNGELLALTGPRYFMLHKPAGYLSATTDSQHPTALDLIQEPRKHLLQIAGRLDLDTTGLLLLTDDGQWNHRITSPRHECIKIYRLTTAEPLRDEYIETFAKGVLLHGEKKPTLPARLELLGEKEARLHIQEGKYHQVKRMLAAVGNRVTSLHREAIGRIQLDPQLKPSEYRALTREEIHHV